LFPLGYSLEVLGPKKRRTQRGNVLRLIRIRLATLSFEKRGLTCQEKFAASVNRWPAFNKVLRDAFVSKGWADQPHVFSEEDDPAAKMDFLKERVGVEVGFGHASFMGIDLLKFQVSSYSGLNQIDVGIYIVTTKRFQRLVGSQFTQKWEGSLTSEKLTRYLPHFKSAIQVPIYVLGIDL
jgi:hypothetical protein